MTLNHSGRQFKDVAPKLSTIRSTMRLGKEEHAVNTAGKPPAGRILLRQDENLFDSNPAHAISNPEDPYTQHIISSFGHVCQCG